MEKGDERVRSFYSEMLCGGSQEGGGFGFIASFNWQSYSYPDGHIIEMCMPLHVTRWISNFEKCTKMSTRSEDETRVWCPKMSRE
ncbi:uncharacterized protein G2W53_038004 [Senna tora]|uniref:Uncharacterized protein n=1 Tax=Senna tora TaxID=362788 RepID=A0A834SND5_9FABA|nr:uncharacterized protein G2W53_038004 [Senna tora]